MSRRSRIGEGTVGKPQSLVNSTEDPQRDGVIDFCCGAGILAETVGKIAVPRWVVKFDSLLKMIMSAGEVAEINARIAASAVRDQGLGEIGPGRGLAQEQLGRFSHRRGFAARIVRRPKTEISGEPFR